MTLTTVARGAMSQIDDPREVVVRTPAEWKALWKEHGSNQELPDIDFARHMVVGVFLGSRPTGGYGVEITDINRKDNDLIVAYREQRPDPSMMVVQILTSPYHLVRIERHDGAVRFQRKTSDKVAKPPDRLK